MNRLFVSALLGIALVAPTAALAGEVAGGGSIVFASGQSRPAELWERANTYVRDKSVRTHIPGRTIAEVVDLQKQVKASQVQPVASAPTAAVAEAEPAKAQFLGNTIAAEPIAQAAQPKQDTKTAELDELATSGSIIFSPGKQQPCIDNPRFNPDNDESGPRASEPYSDSTPYAGTPAVASGAACR
ncbi:hypothetical protein [Gloeobacter violaceus]|uniref:Glr0024 protein n=1 Tax=Gloeobacter violaceus (strain ATCC 29082 / PCC 7421) TaxID=251221 RepID=Q7NPN1_GLOVI|nr:hypothetical protein [Gloeobacter violaceus]BAC87965.1 glr0024 [Gloeobacter violaceus PCC 7421]